jgi:3-hydroxyisobutyrate dehydrogenase
MTITRVGFIGLGEMGPPVAAHLADAGFAMTVSDAAPG